MKAEMGSSTKPILAILVIAALSVAFWMLALGPKREQADELSKQVTQLSSTLESTRGEILVATAAKRSFPADYRQLVTLGQAVPEGDETASLLVELEGIAADTGVKFNGIQLSSEGGGESAGTSSAGASGTPIPPTEVAASLLPLGATVGSAGLAVMPYNLDFNGDFFAVANFIKKVDSLVKPKSTAIAVDGRLMTIDGFSLSADTERGFPHLTASFSVTTYLTPPEQGTSAGAIPSEPSAAIPSAAAAPAATAENASSSSETVSAR
jgi:Tfp pilus assembly protein PilO